MVAANTPEFNSKKDLAFLAKKGSVVTKTHEYRNQGNQLLGYAVRIEEKGGGRKQRYYR